MRVVAQGVVTGERGSVGSLVWVLWWEWFHSCMGVWVRGAVNVGKYGRRGVRVQGPAGAQTRGGEATVRGDAVALKRVQGECVGVWVSGGGGASVLGGCNRVLKSQCLRGCVGARLRVDGLMPGKHRCLGSRRWGRVRLRQQGSGGTRAGGNECTL